MPFKYKSIAEMSKMTESEQEVYATEKRNFEAEQVTKQIQEATKELATKNAELERVSKEQGIEMAKLKEGALDNESKNVSLEGEIKTKKEELKGIVNGQDTTKEIVLKAPTFRASIVNSNSQMVLGGITQLGRKVRGLYDVFSKVQIPNGNNAGKVTYTDWDEATSINAAAFVAEGNVFPEDTAKFASYEEKLKKIGSTLPVSDEFGEDEVSAAAELSSFVETGVESKIDNSLMNGLGGANDLDGFINKIPAYVAVAQGIPAANIYDLVKKVKTDITFNRGSKYKPDFVVMNDNVADSLHLEKDANENYIFPDKMNIGSIMIIIDNTMADNQLAVGDSRYGTIYEKGGVALSRVFVNQQAIEGMSTILAKKRLFFLIRNGDLTGFRKVLDVNAALVTLSTPV